MNPRTKSILVIVATLIIGAGVGALATSAIINNRLEELQALRERGGLMWMIERAVVPTDEGQAARIRAIVDSAATRQMEIREQAFRQHTALFDSLRTKLDTVLTEEQRTRLDEWLKADRGPRFGPPPGGRHPGGPPHGPPPDGFGPPPPPPDGFGPPPHHFGPPPHGRVRPDDSGRDTSSH